MPIIVGPIEYELEPPAWRVHQNATRIVHNRHPSLEMWITLVRIIVVVEEQDWRAAGVDDQCVIAGCRQRLLGVLHKPLQMRRVQLIDLGFAHISSNVATWQG